MFFKTVTFGATGGNMAAVTLLVAWSVAVALLLCTDPGTATEPAGTRTKVRRHSLRSGKAGGGEDGVCELEISCKSDDFNPLLPVRLPIRGPRGPPGPKGDRGSPGDDGATHLYPNAVPDKAPQTGSSTASAVTSGDGRRKVAFFVGLSENLGPVHENRDVIFDRVVTNLGSGYSKATGRFTAPLNATYQFNVVISAQGRQKAAVTMVKNGAMVATVWAESIPFWASASNVAVLSLAPGDQVWLQLLSRASYLHGYMYSTFSGFLVFEN